MTTSSTAAPATIRPSTIWIGAMPSKATLMNRKLQPQMVASRQRRRAADRSTGPTTLRVPGPLRGHEVHETARYHNGAHHRAAGEPLLGHRCRGVDLVSPGDGDPAA